MLEEAKITSWPTYYMAHTAAILVICSGARWLEWNSDHEDHVALVSILNNSV